jgi:hypothetical protein
VLQFEPLYLVLAIYLDVFELFAFMVEIVVVYLLLDKRAQVRLLCLEVS